jgi:predicted ATPase
MKINTCRIENFTVFKKQELEFCDGVNIIIGANATGKSHLLKILYAMAQAIPGKERAARNDADIFRLYGMLNGVFKPEDGEVNTMIRSQDRKTPAVFHLQSDLGQHYAELRRDYHIAVGNLVLGKTEPRRWRPSQIDEPPGLFIPPNEVLAIYPGFAASYEKRELAFDQTYYDICRALSAAPLRQNNADFSPLTLKLEDILSGKVIQKGDRFYVQNKKSEKALEAHLLAEGHRKIAAVVHLINNGSIRKDTALFWDEPEANLNPSLIKHIALSLRELAKLGIQIFIATHDYLLTGELSLAAEYNNMAPQVPIRFFAMSREKDGPVDIQSGNTLADLQDNPILDEFAAHYERERLLFYDQTRTESTNE